MEALQTFVETVLAQGAAHNRNLPWRDIDDPYAVLVSEVMLQQTQVARVMGRWERWLQFFPTVDALAAAPVSAVLEQWQGLGYNRRALMLKRAAEQCARDFGGQIPRTEETLRTLPGIGPATAAGVAAFAFNEWALYVETNVRTVFIVELFAERESVRDREIRDLLSQCCRYLQDCCPQVSARRWYYALLDYGAYCKSVLPNPSRRSSGYARQDRFEGSHRQKRAELLRFVLAEQRCTLCSACDHLAQFERSHGRNEPDEQLVARILEDLAREGFFRKEGDAWVL